MTKRPEYQPPVFETVQAEAEKILQGSGNIDGTNPGWEDEF